MPPWIASIASSRRCIVTARGRCLSTGAWATSSRYVLVPASRAKIASMRSAERS
jgi:hypothetical protein